MNWKFLIDYSLLFWQSFLCIVHRWCHAHLRKGMTGLTCDFLSSSCLKAQASPTCEWTYFPFLTPTFHVLQLIWSTVIRSRRLGEVRAEGRKQRFWPQSSSLVRHSYSCAQREDIWRSCPLRHWRSHTPLDISSHKNLNPFPFFRLTWRARQ